MATFALFGISETSSSIRNLEISTTFYLNCIGAFCNGARFGNTVTSKKS